MTSSTQGPFNWSPFPEWASPMPPLYHHQIHLQEHWVCPLPIFLAWKPLSWLILACLMSGEYSLSWFLVKALCRPSFPPGKLKMYLLFKTQLEFHPLLKFPDYTNHRWQPAVVKTQLSGLASWTKGLYGSQGLRLKGLCLVKCSAAVSWDSQFLTPTRFISLKGQNLYPLSSDPGCTLQTTGVRVLTELVTTLQKHSLPLSSVDSIYWRGMRLVLYKESTGPQFLLQQLHSQEYANLILTVKCQWKVFEAGPAAGC